MQAHVLTVKVVHWQRNRNGVHWFTLHTPFHAIAFQIQLRGLVKVSHS